MFVSRPFQYTPTPAVRESFSEETLDFGQSEKEGIPTDAEGNELPPPEVPKDDDLDRNPRRGAHLRVAKILPKSGGEKAEKGRRITDLRVHRAAVRELRITGANSTRL